MKLNHEVWFKQLEFTLQTIAMYYPTNPNTVCKKKYYDFVQNLPVFFPEYPMGKNIIDLLDKYPVTPYLDSRMSFMKWVHFIGNKIREQQKKPLIDFYDYLDIYYETYKPDDMKANNQKETMRKYIQFALFVAMTGLIIYLYKK